MNGCIVTPLVWERSLLPKLPPSSRSPSFATAALRQRQRRLIGELTLPALIFALPPALHIAAHFPSKLTNVLPLHLLAASMTSSSPRRHLAHHFLPRPNPLSPPSGQPPPLLLRPHLARAPKLSTSIFLFFFLLIATSPTNLHPSLPPTRPNHPTTPEARGAVGAPAGE